MKNNKITSQLQEGLLAWYPFTKEAEIWSIEDATKLDVDALEQKTYDYILIPNSLERCQDPVEILRLLYRHLKTDGRLLFGMNNRFGLRFFAGDADPYTHRSMDSVEGYRQLLTPELKALEGRCYSRNEMKELLKQAGFLQVKFYSVLPRLQEAQLIYAEDYLPKEDLTTRYFPRYDNPDIVFLNEENVYQDFIENDLFHQTANAYLVECVKNSDQFAKVLHATLSSERSEEDSFATIIYQDNRVCKKALYEAGVHKLHKMLENGKDLREHGIDVVAARMVGNEYEMPCINAPIALNYLQDLLVSSKELFLKRLDEFRDLVFQSSEQTVSESGEVLLKRGYIDLVPLNCFYTDKGYLFYDQEFWVENLPANVIMQRTISIIYAPRVLSRARIPLEEIKKRYGLQELWSRYCERSGEFIIKLRNLKEQRVYLERHQKNYGAIHANRQRMNYSETDYQRLFVDIFKNLEDKKLILFGSGQFTRKFLALYQKDFPVYAILDNNKEKWGTMLDGMEIQSPEMLNTLMAENYKVIVCIKNYLSVFHQLTHMGVKNLGIFSGDMEYPMQHKRVVQSVDRSHKKYKTGYIAGVFDLFHIGHLNLLKRAKEQCEYLIVGVVSDRQVREYKKTEPFVPLEERIEMVRACKYVDEAVEIPFGYGGTRDAYRMYHFDVQFSGSDYINDQNWLAEKEFLEKNGAELIFFPYTQSTSSTKLKEAINHVIEKK